ncbi:DUF6167 family protein [Streptomyces sp. NPDC054784]
MFRRAFWFTTGAAAGVWATNKAHRKLRSLTPESLAARAADKAIETGHRLRDFAVDVRTGMVQREDELHDALGLDAPVDADHPELPARAAPASRAARPLGPPPRAPQLGHQARPRTHGQARPDTGHPHPTHPYDRNEDH